MNPPKLLVGCPTSDYHEYCLKEYAEAIKNLSYNNYDVLLVDNSQDKKYYKKIEALGIKAIRYKYSPNVKERIINSRNILRKYAVDNSYDYLFSLEQDIIPPKNIIENLLKHDKRVISGIYYSRNKQGILKPVIYRWKSSDLKDEEMYEVEISEVEKPRLLVACTGLGCILIHRDILKDIEFRYDKNRQAFDDWCFCWDLKKKGIKVYVDTSIKCKHLISKRSWTWQELK